MLSSTTIPLVQSMRNEESYQPTTVRNRYSVTPRLKETIRGDVKQLALLRWTSKTMNAKDT